MLLEGKNAVVHGAGGSIGGAVARAFAAEGATVHLAGRSQPPIEAVAQDIRAAGGRAETAVVDALDPSAVDAHANAVADDAGAIDVCMNLIGHDDRQGTPMAEMDVEDYLAPVVTGVRTNFLTAKAAARHMIPRGSGVILFFGGDGPPMAEHSLGGLQTGLTAIEAMRRQLAAELGRYGIRTVSLRTGGIPEGIPDDFAPKGDIEKMIAATTMTGHPATLADVGAAAAFAASDKAIAMTAATINVSAGALID